jgi:His-Xaa-Ser system protein HxsD
MPEIDAKSDNASVTLEFDEALYPKEAIYGAAYVFIDRCWVHLDRPREGRVSVRLAKKPEVGRAVEDLAGEFENELLGQAWRRQIVDENRRLLEQVSSMALAGAAGPPGLDELLSMDVDDATAFEDPLGIAMSWEEKYKKKEPAPDPSKGEDPK